MGIRGKRIRHLDAYAKVIPQGNDVLLGVVNPATKALGRAGFPTIVENGTTILPASMGPISRFNAEGKAIPHKDQPMETAYRTVEWHWTEWHGPYRVEQTDFRDVPYERYPRTFVPPPSVELTIATDSDGNRIVRTPVMHDWKSHKADVLHAANLLLELFGECEFYDTDLRRLVEVPIKRLNWRILPPGQRPWASLRKEIKPIVDELPKGNRPVVQYRLETINKYKPDFAAIGEAGFRGYIILGFSGRNLYVLESLFYGNATYVFGERWEELSKKTKAEILAQGLQSDRFIHRSGWKDNIRQLLVSSKVGKARRRTGNAA